MPKKLSPPASKNIPVSKTTPTDQSPAAQEQLAVSGVKNTDTSLQTTGTSLPTDTLSLPAVASEAKPKIPQKTWGATASPSGTSTSRATASASRQSQISQKSFVAMAASSAASNPSRASSASSQVQLPKIPSKAMASTNKRGFNSRAPTTAVSESQKIKIAQLLTELKAVNDNVSNYPREITTILYQISKLKFELSDEEKLILIDFISYLNFGLWSNMNFIHLVISLKYCGIFDKKISQDTDGKQAHLFKKLVEVAEEVICDPRIYHKAGFYSFLSRIIKAISTSDPSLVEPNKIIITRSLKSYINNIDKKRNIMLNPDDIYQLLTSIFELRNMNIITHQEAGELAKPYIMNHDITLDIHNVRDRKTYIFICRNLINKDDTYKGYKDRLAEIYNQAIDLIDSFTVDSYEPFYLFDEINYLFFKKLINIEACNLESLMGLIEGRIHTLLDKPFFGKFHINLYNLETTPFAKTQVYERLKKEYHACLNKNIHKMNPASIVRIETHIAKSKVSYITDKKLDTSIADNLALMLSKICSENSELTKENCLASLDVFAHKMGTSIHREYFQHFKTRIIPILLVRYNQLTYDEKVKLIKVLPLTKNEKDDHVCKKIIAGLCNTFTANTEQYMTESVSFLNAIANLGDYNSDIIPFVELSRKALVIDETQNKSHLIKCLKFYSFAYACFILQEQESDQPQKQLSSMKEEMKEKLALTVNLLESQYKKSFFNDDWLMLNFAHGLLRTGKQYDVNFVYTATRMQNEMYEALAEAYQLEKEKDIQLEASLFGLPGIDIYLTKYKLALEIDGEQHFQGADNNSVSGKSLIQKAILSLNGINLINIKNLTRRNSLILEDIKQQIDAFLRKKEDDASS